MTTLEPPREPIIVDVQAYCRPFSVDAYAEYLVTGIGTRSAYWVKASRSRLDHIARIFRFAGRKRLYRINVKWKCHD